MLRSLVGSEMCIRDSSSVVALAVRLVIDKKMGGTPNYADLTTTVRLRNAGAQ